MGDTVEAQRPTRAQARWVRGVALGLAAAAAVGQPLLVFTAPESGPRWLAHVLVILPLSLAGLVVVTAWTWADRPRYRREDRDTVLAGVDDDERARVEAALRRGDREPPADAPRALAIARARTDTLRGAVPRLLGGYACTIAACLLAGHLLARSPGVGPVTATAVVLATVVAFVAFVVVTGRAARPVATADRWAGVDDPVPPPDLETVARDVDLAAWRRAVSRSRAIAIGAVALAALGGVVLALSTGDRVTIAGMVFAVGLLVVTVAATAAVLVAGRPSTRRAWRTSMTTSGVGRAVRRGTPGDSPPGAVLARARAETVGLPAAAAALGAVSVFPALLGAAAPGTVPVAVPVGTALGLVVASFALLRTARRRERFAEDLRGGAVQ